MEEEIDILHYYQILKKRKSLILQITLTLSVVILVSSIFLRFYYPTYESKATLLMSTSTSLSSSTLSSISSLLDKSDIDIETQMQIIQNPVIAKLAAKGLDNKIDDEKLLDKIDVEAIPNSTLIAIKGYDEDALTARNIANAFAKAFTLWTKAKTLKSINEQKQAVSTELDKTESKLATYMKSGSDNKKINELLSSPTLVAALYGNLVQRYSDLEISGRVANSNVQIVSWAETPKDPTSPKIVKNTILGILVGLVFAVFAAFILEFKENISEQLPKNLSRKEYL